MKSGTNSSVEGDDDSNDGVPESYRRKSLSPETPSSTSYFHPGREKRRHLPAQSDSKHSARYLVGGNVRSITYPVRDVVPGGPSPVSGGHRIHILVAPFVRRSVGRRLWLQSPMRQMQVGRKLRVKHGGRSPRSSSYLWNLQLPAPVLCMSLSCH
jgi:hypothetical protein